MHTVKPLWQNHATNSLKRRTKIRLQWRDFKTARAHRLNCHQGRARARDGGIIGNSLRQRSSPQTKAVGDRLDAFGRIEHQIYFIVGHGVDDVGPALEDLVDGLDGDAGGSERPRHA